MIFVDLSPEEFHTRKINPAFRNQINDWENSSKRIIFKFLFLIQTSFSSFLKVEKFIIISLILLRENNNWKTFAIKFQNQPKVNK